MKCPYCGYKESKVIDSRPAEEGSSIRRRRECLSCAKRFTTYETVESLPMVVIKKDGSRQSFDKRKVLNGMIRACEKRPVPFEVLEQKADEIVNGGLTLDMRQKLLFVDGEAVRLTATEYKITELLMRHIGQVFSAAQIYENVWNENADFSVENTVMVHIRHIREKIEIDPKNPRYVKVVWGIGYKMEKHQK